MVKINHHGPVACKCVLSAGVYGSIVQEFPSNGYENIAGNDHEI
jgi:hypothetical protein